MSRILCIHLPLWPIQRRIAAQPELRGQPVALHAPLAQRGELVRVCSPRARQLGIRPGMPVAEAAAIGNHTAAAAPLVLLEHHPAADRAALESLADWSARFSPIVGLEDAAEPNCLLLDASGLAPLFHGEPAYLATLAHEIRAAGYHASCALADTIGAAWAVAHTAEDATTIVPPGDTRQALACLTPAALRLPEETTAMLADLGVVQIGQLLALPREALLARFGDLLVQRLLQAEGAIAETIIAHQTREPFAAAWSLEHPTNRTEVIDRVFEYLCDRLSAQLDKHDRGAVQVVCQLALVDRPAAQFTVGLYRPTAKAAHLLQLVRLQLEQQRLPAPVGGVQLHATVTAPLEVEQAELFPDRQRTQQQSTACLIDRLASRIGAEYITGVEPAAEALPERAVRETPLAWRHRSHASGRLAAPRRRSRPRQNVPAPIKPRPLVMHAPPQAIAVLSVAPHGPPRRFQWNGKAHLVQQQWGPERIETSWWRGRTVRRDYWRVETDCGQRFWLFRDLNDGAWFLHGEFD